MSETYLDLLPTDIYQLILKHKAAITIQEKTFKIFYKNHGPTWKKEIRIIHRTLVYDLDYWCYLQGINDPWYDYCDDPLYAY